jgi:methylmalonyl-CoA/ethylmalonyl-CoA epimerase
MINMNDTSLELAQICWVIPDINATIKFLSHSLGIVFPEPDVVRAQELNMTYYGKVMPGEWLTTQANHGTFLELVQPISGQSMFRDFLDTHPMGGVQHHAFRLPVDGFERVISNFRRQGYTIISEVDHPIARMTFFDTYKTLGVVTEIMGITPYGWRAIEGMKKARGKEKHPEHKSN